MCREPACREAIHEIKARLERQEHFISGNGRPGLLERMASLERAIAVQTWLIRAVVGGCVTIMLKQWFG